MSTSVGELIATLRLDSAAFIAGVNAAKDKLKEFGANAGNADKAVAGLKEGLGYAAAGFGVITTALAAVSASAIQAASNFSETTNVMQQGFGKSAASAESWAEKTGSAMGRTTQQMREFASVNQAMLSAMVGSAEAAAPMSTALAQLAVDMGSFWNVADKDAFAALRSAMTGETEPMRRFGVVMTEAALNAYALSEGIKLTTQQMTEGEKATLRYHFILDKTKLVQGDAVKTADSLANQLKALEADQSNLSKTLGDQLLPQAQAFVAIIRDMISVLGGGDGLSTVVGGIGSALRTMIDIVLQATEGWALMFKVIAQGSNYLDEDNWDKRIDAIRRMRSALAGEGKNSTQAGGGRFSLGNGMMGHYDDNGKLIIDTATNASSGGAGWQDQFRGKGGGKADKFNAGDYTTGAVEIDTKWEDTFGVWQLEVAKIGVGFEAVTTDWKAVYDQFQIATQVIAQTGTWSDKPKTPAELSEERRREMDKRKAVNAYAAGGMSSMMRGDFGGAGANGISSVIAEKSGKEAAAFVAPFISEIMSGVKHVFSEIQRAVQLFGETFAKPFMANDQRMGKAMGTGMAVGGVSAPFVVPAVLMSLAQETKSYAQYQAALTKGVDKVVKALEPAFQQLLPLAGLFIQLSESVGILVANLIPGPIVATAMFNAFKGLAEGVAWSIVGMINFRVGITALVAEVF